MSDIVGHVEQVDEHHITMARGERLRYFGHDDEVVKTYYKEHPEFLKTDTRIICPGAPDRLGGDDNPVYKAWFGGINQISTEDFVDGVPAETKIHLTPERAREKIKAFARLLGADLVGTGPLKQEWVYSVVGRHFNLPGFLPMGTPINLSHHPNAIAVGVRMDYQLTQGAPYFPVQLATARGYSIICWIAVQMANYIRRMGYSARAHHLGNYQVMVVPVAIDCGLGELSRAGIMLNKEFGLAVRTAVITTDMPLIYDQPVDIGVQSFCEQCRICADNCPVGAISKGEKEVHNGIKRWKLNGDRCYQYWHKIGTNCGICMARCPWTKPQNWLHKGVSVLASVPGSHQGLMARADKLLRGRNKNAPAPGYLEPIQENIHKKTPQGES